MEDAGAVTRFVTEADVFAIYHCERCPRVDSATFGILTFPNF